MKTIQMIFSTAVILACASCSNSTEPTTTAPPPETIAPEPQPQSQTHEAKKEETSPDHTEIGVDENGVNYSKKDGKNETDVNIKTDSGKFSIRKRK